MFRKKKKGLLNLDALTLLPFAKNLLEFLQRGLIKGVALHAQGKEPLDEALVAFLIEEMKEWNPKINGIPVMDNKTKLAGARFLGGITYSYFLKAKEKEKNV